MFYFPPFHTQAAEETGRKIKIYAVEKNPNAVVTLHVSCSSFCIANCGTLPELS